jgi:hypothetical protein
MPIVMSIEVTRNRLLPGSQTHPRTLRIARQIPSHALEIPREIHRDLPDTVVGGHVSGCVRGTEIGKILTVLTHVIATIEVIQKNGRRGHLMRHALHTGTTRKSRGVGDVSVLSSLLKMMFHRPGIEIAQIGGSLKAVRHRRCLKKIYGSSWDP